MYRITTSFLVPVVLAGYSNALAQGFNLTPIEWPVPVGGGVNTGGDPMGFWFTNGGEPVNGHQFWETLDMNGDGRPDLVVTGERSGGWPRVFDADSQPHWRVHLNTGSGFDADATPWNLPAGGEHLGFSTNLGYWAAEYSSTNDDDNTWTLQDMNGDQLPDLVVTAVADNGSPRAFSPTSAPFWKVHLNSGVEFASVPITWPLPAGGIVFGADVQSFPFFRYESAAPGSHAWATQDINGDELPDLVLTAFEQASFDAATDPHWSVHLNTGTGFAMTAVDFPLPPGGGIYSGEASGFPRFDSDVYAPGSDVWRLRDMDADGRPDLVLTSGYDGTDFTCYGWGSAPYWKVHLNTGSAFNPTAIQWTLPEGGASGSAFYGFHDVEQDFANSGVQQAWGLIDLGGDGPPDLVVTSDMNDGSGVIMFGGDEPHWRRFTSTGTGFSASFTAWSLPIGGMVYPDTGFAELELPDASQFGEELWRATDMNGDSLADLVVTGRLPDGIPYEQVFDVDSAPYWKVYLQNSDVSVPMTDPAGGLTAFPNPFSGVLALQVPPALIGQNMVVLDATGRTVMAMTVRRSAEAIELTHVPPGMYMVRYGSSMSRVVKR